MTDRFHLRQMVCHPFQHNIMRSIDMGQLHQSRLGLVTQASMLIITVCFLMSDVLGEFWKDK